MIILRGFYIRRPYEPDYKPFLHFIEKSALKS